MEFLEYSGRVRESALVSTLLSTLSGVDGGIFYRITMTSMTQAWYMQLTTFESILLGLIILQIFVMRYLQILPLNITKLIEDGTLLSTDYSKRKKREIQKHRERLADIMFTILRRLDHQDCLLRAICQMQNAKQSSPCYQLPKEMAMTLEILNRSGQKRRKTDIRANNNNITIADRPVVAVFEEAVLIGAGQDGDIFSEMKVGNNNVTDSMIAVACEQSYSQCPATRDEIMYYVDVISKTFYERDMATNSMNLSVGDELKLAMDRNF